MKALMLAGGYVAVALGAVGSSLGTGIAGSAAIGAWKKCYAQDKPAPFLLVALAGAPLSQTIYGMILMLLIKTHVAKDFAMWPMYLGLGVFCGIALAFSAWYQGKVSAAACDAYAETGKGFSNYLMLVGVVETISIFALVFTLLIMG